MIANFFNKTKPVIFFNIVTLLFGYSFIKFFLQGSIELSLSYFLKWMGFFFLHVLFLILFKFIVKKNRLTKDNSYALFLAVILIGVFSEGIFLNYIVFSNIILLLSLRKVYSLRSGMNTKMKLFDAAFWVGVSTLIYSWSIFYILLIYIGILIYQRVSLKNLLIPLVGLATPIFIYFTYNLYFDNLAVFYSRFNYDTNLVFVAYNSLQFLIPISFLTAILLWSIVALTPKIVLISNNLRFSWIVLLNHLLISLLIIIVSPVKNGSELFYLVFPSAIIITNYIQKIESSNFKNLILYLFLIISVICFL